MSYELCTSHVALPGARGPPADIIIYHVSDDLYLSDSSLVLVFALYTR